MDTFEIVNYGFVDTFLSFSKSMSEKMKLIK